MQDPRDARKDELFVRLQGTYDLLQKYQEEHHKTGFGCVRSGGCCQVGLQLHMMECENIARLVQAMPANEKRNAIARLKRSLGDPEWNWDSSIGERMCAFYVGGCTIYPVRPAICRMYGVILEADDFCPRDRLAGRSFVYVQKDVDELVKDYYKTLDTYGRMYPERDYTVYMPAGVLSFLLPPESMKKLKATTAKKFWKRERGYRVQFRPSYRRGASLQTNVSFPFALPVKR